MGKEIILAYLKATGLNASQLAKMCRLSKGSTYSFLRGKPMSRTSAIKLEKGTHGKIKARQVTDKKI